MSSCEIHYEQYKHNKNFYSFGMSNNKGPYYDWEVTVCFYTAIHLIEAVLDKKHSISYVKSHDKREKYMKDYPETFSVILRDYFFLVSTSHRSRYVGFSNIKEIESRQAFTRLENIESYLLKYIK